MLSRNSTGAPGGGEASGGFGPHTSTGDINGDGYVVAFASDGSSRRPACLEYGNNLGSVIAQ